MALNDKQIETLEKIVEYKGNCLIPKLCLECPFKSSCLPKFLSKPITQQGRADMAMNVLMSQSLLDEEIDIESFIAETEAR